MGAARTGCLRQGKFDMGGRFGWWGGAGRLLEYGRAGRVSRRPAPERRLSWSGIRWQIGRLEAVDRHCVGSVADLELEGERRAAKDLEWAGVGRGERWVGGRGADKNHRRGEELWRKEWRWVSGRWLAQGTRKRGFQISEKMKGLIFR